MEPLKGHLQIKPPEAMYTSGTQLSLTDRAPTKVVKTCLLLLALGSVSRQPNTLQKGYPSQPVPPVMPTLARLT